ncbi:uncharacterized protein Fot_40005 [Forsythia ovata]|uniref:Uncharacterized protein n=1 Tax=Forsythia ovata TaxID=205694 RepID=A0ABD1S682_9LAMI
MRGCPKFRSFCTIVETQTESSNSQDSGSGQIGSLQLFNALNTKTVSGLNGVKGLMYVEAIINGQPMQALVDTNATLQFHNGGGGLFNKMVDSIALPLIGAIHGTELCIDTWHFRNYRVTWYLCKQKTFSLRKRMFTISS